VLKLTKAQRSDLSLFLGLFGEFQDAKGNTQSVDWLSKSEARRLYYLLKALEEASHA